MPKKVFLSNMIYVFSGDNTYLRDKEAKEIVSAFIARYGDISVQKFNGDDISIQNLPDLILAQPFLTDKRMVQIRDLSKNKIVYEEFLKLAVNMPDTADVVLVEDRMDSRPKTTATLKDISDFREFANLDGIELTHWLMDTFKKRGSVISNKDANYLIDRVGSSQEVLANEAAKLCLQKTPITTKLIDELTVPSPHSSIFTMLDNIASGNLKGSLRLYEEQKMQGMEPQAILGMITWQLVSLATVATAKGMNPAEIASKSSLSPYVVRKNQNLAKKLTKNKLIKMFDLAIDADTKLKTTSANVDKVIAQLITDLAVL
jgi:DNA polymerase III delta subunit